ncbi:hypothetical protein DdX_16033 [Ditylenchus destructor]|uniref:F-box domain-containing protein n=1 Tax=Ditylenchus destructor TaxID=166010 RepID=A0AAD4QX53_9BILA|nr:hypothetical protein DdX_16033 [Ditylenchus destructor]
MSCSKPLPPFTFDVLCYLNRDQLERISIVCRPLKNIIDRYFHSKPYRVFEELLIHRGSYALHRHYDVFWHPNRDGYSVQQFLAGQECSSIVNERHIHYSFAEMIPYLGMTVRIKWTVIYVDYTYSPDQIAEMESIAYLWRDGDIYIRNYYSKYNTSIVAEDFLPILNSPTILQCRNLIMNNAHFSFKDYKVLYSLKVIEVHYYNYPIDPDSWLQFLDQPGVKPIVVLRQSRREVVDNVLNRFVKAFSSAVSPNPFKIVFAGREVADESLIEFRETNKTSGEILELKKGLPVEYCEGDEFLRNDYKYTLERSSL